ncbi:hypothetical protein ZWY2020_029831 [Hordeum vulgare]|nr:hypothetical protein ZWY2020_029831 [Hordeum vulgare]
MEQVTKLAGQRAVVIFGTSSCCMCHTVTSLLRDIGANPTMVDWTSTLEGRRWRRPSCGSSAEPCRTGGVHRRQARRMHRQGHVLHLGGKLVPLLRNAGAVWV